MSHPNKGSVVFQLFLQVRLLSDASGSHQGAQKAVPGSAGKDISLQLPYVLWPWSPDVAKGHFH